MKKRVIEVKVLPGQDPAVVVRGAGRVCIHLVVPDSSGPFIEPKIMQIDKVKQMHGEVALFTGPKTCKLACDPKRMVKPIEKNGVITVTMRTGDPRAATCPRCIASEDYKRIIKVLTDAQQGVPDETPTAQES